MPHILRRRGSCERGNKWERRKGEVEKKSGEAGDERGKHEDGEGEEGAGSHVDKVNR